MPSYLSLGNYTAEGLASFEDVESRLAAAKQAVSDAGGRLIFFYLTFGEYDIAAVVELPDDEAAARLSINKQRSGMITGKTVRCFTEDETIALAGSLGG